MAKIELQDLAHTYDERTTGSSAAVQWALHPMTMTWEDGGAYALLGPS
jgi:glycerol transport system ATP-binding protein